MILHLFLYIISFVIIWYGSGLIVSAVSKFSSRLRLSAFAFSFVFLGILTSIPEFSVGMQSIIARDPEIFVGNLLGGVVVLFLFIIPVLAVFGNGTSLKHEFDKKSLVVTMGVILAPAFFILDKRVTSLEGFLMVVLYFILLYLVQRKNGIFDKNNSNLLNSRAYSYKDLLIMAVGVVLVFLSSGMIVNQTTYFAEALRIPAFYISLIVIALGTNLPELSLAVRSVVSGKKEIAMGDYIGSASVNTLLFGFFTLMSNGRVLTVNHFFVTFYFIAIGLIAFYILSYFTQYISRAHGLILLAIYVVFVLTELSG